MEAAKREFEHYFSGDVVEAVNVDALRTSQRIQRLLALTLKYPTAFCDSLSRILPRALKRGQRGPGPSQRNLRTFVMMQTAYVLQIGSIGSITFSPPRLRESVESTQVYDGSFPSPLPRPVSEVTIVRCVRHDTFVAAASLIRRGRNPCVLNMANARHAGGGFERGAGAQEEDLFRRSSYCQALAGMSVPTSWQVRARYPLSEYGAIYTPSVCYFRDTAKTGYAFLPHPVEICCVAAAAIDRSRLPRCDYLSSDAAMKTKRKIRTIFRVAIDKHHDSLVLGAFGCGAFRNPPDHIAQIFSEVIEEFAGHFQEVVFAILSDANDRRGNYARFSAHLGTSDRPVSFRRTGGSLVASRNQPEIPDVSSRPPASPSGFLSSHVSPSRQFSPPSDGVTGKVGSADWSSSHATVAPHGLARGHGSTSYPTNLPHQKPVCEFGARCYRENPAHARDYIHPPGWTPAPKPHPSSGGSWGY